MLPLMDEFHEVASRVARLDQHVRVVRHQAIGVDQEVERASYALQGSDGDLAAVAIGEDLQMVLAADGHEVDVRADVVGCE